LCTEDTPTLPELANERSIEKSQEKMAALETCKTPLYQDKKENDSGGDVGTEKKMIQGHKKGGGVGVAGREGTKKEKIVVWVQREKSVLKGVEENG